MAANLSPSKKRKQLVLDLVATLIVLLLALLVVLPIWWIFRSSLMSTAKLNEYPPYHHCDFLRICLCKTSFPRQEADL